MCKGLKRDAGESTTASQHRVASKFSSPTNHCLKVRLEDHTSREGQVPDEGDRGGERGSITGDLGEGAKGWVIRPRCSSNT